MTRHQDIVDLLNATETRAAQLAALAIVVQDSLDVRGGIDKRALQNTAWLMADLLKEQHEAVIKLQKLYCG